MQGPVSQINKVPWLYSSHPVLAFIYSRHVIIDHKIRKWPIFISVSLLMIVQSMYFTKVPHWRDGGGLAYTTALCLCECRNIFFFAKRFDLFTKACPCQPVSTKRDLPFPFCLKLLCRLCVYIFAYAYTQVYIHTFIRLAKGGKRQNTAFVLLMNAAITSDSYVIWNWMVNKPNEPNM